MNFLSHIKISKVLYKYLNTHMELDKRAFVYGNIKPDLSKELMKHPHTLGNYFGIMCKHVDNITNNHLESREYSLELGQVCHYICDFFCLYHLDEEIWNRKKEHFLYEVKLHIELLKSISKLKPEPAAKISEYKIATLITELRKEYEAQSRSKKKDIEYSITAMIAVCAKLSVFSPSFEDASEISLVESYYFTPSG